MTVLPLLLLFSAFAGATGCSEAVVELIARCEIDRFLQEVELPIASSTVSFVECIDEKNREFVAGHIFDDSYYPDVDLSNATGTFQFVQISDLPDDVPEEDILEFADSILQRAEVGFCVAQVDYKMWDSSDIFTSYAIVDTETATVAFEPILSLVGIVQNITDDEGDAIRRLDELGAGSDQRSRLLAGSEVTDETYDQVRNKLGMLAVDFECSVTARCSGSTRNSCDGEHEARSYLALWTAEGQEQVSESAPNCCTNTCQFAYASGFKSISVGDKLSISGSLGSGSTFSRTAFACCCDPTEGPTPSPVDDFSMSYTTPDIEDNLRKRLKARRVLLGQSASNTSAVLSSLAEALED